MQETQNSTPVCGNYSLIKEFVERKIKSCIIVFMGVNSSAFLLITKQK